MEAVERGLAGTRKRGPRNDPDGDDVPCEISDRDSGDPKEHNGSGDASGGVPHVEVDYPFSLDCINYNYDRVLPDARFTLQIKPKLISSVDFYRYCLGQQCH